MQDDTFSMRALPSGILRFFPESELGVTIALGHPEPIPVLHAEKQYRNKRYSTVAEMATGEEIIYVLQVVRGRG